MDLGTRLRVWRKYTAGGKGCIPVLLQGSETSSDQLSPLPQRIKTKRRGLKEPLPITGKSFPNASPLCPPQDSKAGESTAGSYQYPTVSLSSNGSEWLGGEKKQKPSKRARKRMRKRLEKMKLKEEKSQEASVITSESGYDTTGDYRGSAANTPMQSPFKTAVLGERSEVMESDGQALEARLGQQISPPKTLLAAEGNALFVRNLAIYCMQCIQRMYIPGQNFAIN